MTLTKDVGLEEFIDDDLIELLVSQRERLSNEELMLFGNEQAENIDETTEVSPTLLKLTTKIIAKSECSIKITRGVYNEQGSYTEQLK